MTVKNLIELLKQEDPDRLVICQRDPEGNGHSPLYSMWTGAYKANNGWSGDVGFESLSESDIVKGCSEEDVITDGVPALMLVPIN